MKQAMMIEPGKIVIQEVEKPPLKDDEVMIRVSRIGVCGSDIHVFHGQHPFTSYPVIQGHEVSGAIAQVGSQVKDLTVGDAVIFMPQVTCGACYPCLHGNYHICDNLKVMGFQTAGAAQEFFPIQAEMVLKLPESISLDEAAMIEPVSVAVHALARGGDVTGRKVLVLGAGTIGNLVAQVARASGAARVLITDISEYKLEKARQCSLEFTVNSLAEDLGQAVVKYFGADKADLILECVGVQNTITQAITQARKGSTIVIVGVFGKDAAVDLAAVQNNELSIVGTLMYQKADFERAIELVAQGKIYLNNLITHRFAFDQYLQAYHAIEASQGEYMKVMVELTG